MRAIDGISLINASAASPLVRLSGGQYSMAAIATWNAGNVALQAQAADGSTLVNVLSGTNMTTNSIAVVYLPPGWYRLNVVSATAVYAKLTRIPGE